MAATGAGEKVSQGELPEALTNQINALIPGQGKARCVVVLYSNPADKKLFTRVFRPTGPDGVDDMGPNHPISVSNEDEVESANFLRGTGSECISYKIGGKRRVFCW